jgi:hypothetical protein
MQDYRRYVVGVLSIVVVIVLLVLGFNLLRNILGGGSKKQSAPVVKTFNLIDASKSGKTVQYTVHGAINGEEQHRSIRISVDPNSRRVEVLQGYNDAVILSQETENTEAAYLAFVKALNGVNFAKSVAPAGRGDEAQTCPLGQRFNYEVAPGTSDSFYSWATSCGGKNTGTSSATNGVVQTLFRKQIPDYAKFTNGVRLN